MEKLFENETVYMKQSAWQASVLLVFKIRKLHWLLLPIYGLPSSIILGSGILAPGKLVFLIGFAAGIALMVYELLLSNAKKLISDLPVRFRFFEDGFMRLWSNDCASYSYDEFSQAVIYKNAIGFFSRNRFVFFDKSRFTLDVADAFLAFLRTKAKVK